jgi:serine/threonine protein kinase
MLHAPPGFEAAPQDRLKTDYTDGDCVPMHEWQTKSFPNCNLVHEYDLTSAGPGVHRNNTNLILEDNLVMLGQGWFRNTWRLDVGSTNEKVVLKTLRLEREFYDEFYDLHRRDALAMERLTHSPFIMDIYGYCGQSALNELADFGDGNLASLEKVDRQLRGTRDPASFLLKLQLATSVAVGVAHIHEIDKDGRPSLVHYDLNPRNVAIVGNGKPKINDFNIAEFLHWNPKTNETCGFAGRLHEPWWRAPEEVAVDSEEDGQLLDEKVDVYALGSILFHVLTTHSPRGKMKKDRIEEVREKVARGEAPFLEEQYAKSKDPAVKAFRRALDLCFEPDPKDRGSAREVADLLLEALVEIKKKRKAQDARKKGKHSRRLAEISSYEARATYIRNESHRVFKGSSKQ